MVDFREIEFEQVKNWEPAVNRQPWFLRFAVRAGSAGVSAARCPATTGALQFRNPRSFERGALQAQPNDVLHSS
eukprot:8590028-Pyramimonas_sp.AAC.1